jgi:hypothetical protein
MSPSSNPPKELQEVRDQQSGILEPEKYTNPPLATKITLPSIAAESTRRSTAVEILELRLETASTTDCTKLVALLGEVKKQSERELDAAHRRTAENRSFNAKVAFSLAAIAVGTGLVVTGFGLPGFFLIGGSAAVYVPDYVKTYFSRNKPDGGDAKV